MIRTAVSFLALFGSLFLVSKALTESQQPSAAQQKSPSFANRLVSHPDGERDACCGDELACADNAEAHSLKLLAIESDLVLLPAAPQSYLPSEERTAEVHECEISTVALEEESKPRPQKTRVLPPQALEGNDFYSGAAEADDSATDDRPIGSGVLSDEQEPADDEQHDGADDAGEPLQNVEGEVDIEAIEETESAESTEDDGANESGDVDQDEDTADADDAVPSEEDKETEPRTSTAVPAALSPEMEELRQQVRNVLAYHIERPEAVERRSPWGIMHALIAYGVDTEVTQGGRRVNAIGWMCFNGPCRGQQLLWAEDGKLRTRQGPGVQGHEGQFLAMLAQSKVKLDFPIRIDGHQFTVADLVEFEKRTCVENTELTFKLIGLSHYLDSDAKWKAASGEQWDLPRLIKEELKQPVIGAACGGTHRMMGFSYAVRKREKQNRPVDGQWLRAKKYVDAYHEYTFKLQNPDGSFSTDWFRGPGAHGTDDRHLETTGHILEWMVYSLPEDKLQDPRTVKAVQYLAALMWDNKEHDWEIGPKGHALHALAIYDERVFQGQPGQRRVQLAAHRDAQAAR